MKPAALGVRFTLAATLVALAVMAVAGLVVASAERAGVYVGGGVALLLQVVGFWVLAVWLFPTRRLMVIGVGMGMRMAALLLMVLLVSRTELSLAPTLLTLVTVFVLTTMLEPVLFQLETKRAG